MLWCHFRYKSHVKSPGIEVECEQIVETASLSFWRDVCGQLLRDLAHTIQSLHGRTEIISVTWRLSEIKWFLCSRRFTNVCSSQWRRGCVNHTVKKSTLCTGLHRSWEFQEVEAPRFHDSRHMKVVRLSLLRTGRLYPPGNIPGTNFCWRLSRSQAKGYVNEISMIEIEPANLQLVAQCLNQLCYRVPTLNMISVKAAPLAGPTYGGSATRKVSVHRITGKSLLSKNNESFLKFFSFHQKMVTFTRSWKTVLEINFEILAVMKI